MRNHNPNHLSSFTHLSQFLDTSSKKSLDEDKIVVDDEAEEDKKSDDEEVQVEENSRDSEDKASEHLDKTSSLSPRSHTSRDSSVSNNNNSPKIHVGSPERDSSSPIVDILNPVSNNFLLKTKKVNDVWRPY